MLDRQMLARARNDQVARRLMTVPGVGVVIALAYTAVLMISLAGSLSPYSHFLHESKERLFASGQKGVKVGGLRVPTQEVSGAAGSARNDTITVCAQGD